ncbi:MAG: TolC family protein [Ignavibacteria bacterium]
MRGKIFFIVLFALNFIYAQELRLSYNELIKLTLENNLTIKSYQEKVNQNKLKENEIFLGTLPQLKLSGRYSRMNKIDPFVINLPFVPGSPQIRVYEPVEEQFYSRISLDFPLFTGLRQINSIKAQKKIAAASEEELNQIKCDVLYKAKELFFNLYLSYQVLKLIETNIEYLETQKKNAENFFKNGLLQENDVLKIDIALTQAKIKFYEQENLINNLNNALCLILNLDPSNRIYPDFDIEKLTQSEEIESYLPHERPEISALKNFISANEFLKKASYGALFPNLFLNAGYDYAKPNPKYFPVKNEWKYSWDVNLILQFNLWDWLLPLNKAQQIETQIKQAEFQLNQLIRKSENERINLINRIQTEKKKIELTKKELGYATENLRITENKFKEGLAATVDLLDANRQKIEAETHLIESKIKLQLLKEELKLLSGTY